MRHAGSIVWICLFIVAAEGQAGDNVERLETSARRFRMQTYESFRLNRRELDRRLQWAERIMSTWKSRGARQDDIPGIVELFRHTANILPGAADAALPSYPVRPARRKPKPRRSLASPPAPPTDRDPRVNPSPHTDSPAATLTPRPSSRARLRSPRNNRHNLSALSPAPTAESATSIDTPSGAPPALVASPPFVSQPSDVTAEAVESLPRAQIRAPHVVEDPPRDEPLMPANPTDIVEYSELTRLPTSSTELQIDLDVLEAKRRSVRFSLAAMEAELTENDDWTIDELEAAASDLSALVNAASLVQLYFTVIPEPERALIGPPADTLPTQALFAQRVFETRIKLVDEIRNENSPSTADELHRLKQISEVMQRWNSDYPN